MSQLGQPFYGLTLRPEDKFRVHQEIFHLVYNTKGGFSHDEVYNMPVYLRYFNMRMLIEQLQKEKEASDAQSQSMTSTPKPMGKPPIVKKPS